jgi:hypothetical protein
VTTPSDEAPLEDRQEVKSDQTASTRRLNVDVGVSILVVLGLVLVSGCGLAPKSTRSVFAAMTLTQEPIPEDVCQGESPYSDIGPGTLATLRDGTTGEILGQKRLSSGIPTIEDCVFSVIFQKVPQDRDSYTFEVGLRGQVEQSLDRMNQTAVSTGDWSFSTFLGPNGATLTTR